MITKKYVIDTSFLINGWDRYYAPRLFPSIWKSIKEQIIEGRIIIPWEVSKEIKDQDDDLTDWINQFKDQINRPTIDEQQELQKVMSSFPNIAAQGGSKNAADPWVIASAMANKGIVVTDERPQSSAKSTKPPKITYVCDQMHINWMRPIDFLADAIIETDAN